MLTRGTYRLLSNFNFIIIIIENLSLHAQLLSKQQNTLKGFHPFQGFEILVTARRFLNCSINLCKTPFNISIVCYDETARTRKHNE